MPNSNSEGVAKIDPSSISFPGLSQGGDEGKAIPEPFQPGGADEGGKGGEETAPPSPPSPPPVAHNAASGATEPFPDEVFRPAPRSNPVIAALKRSGLYGSNKGSGNHELTCPWSAEHEGGNSLASYVEPTPQSPAGRFGCDECRARHASHLIDHLDVDQSSARCRPLIRNVRGEMHRVVDAAESVLAKQPDYFFSGDSIVRIRPDPNTGDVSTEQVSEQVLAMALSATLDFESYDGRSKTWSRIDVPPRTLLSLIRKGQYRHLRELRGLARQPFISTGTDELVRTSGYDKASAIFAAFDGASYRLPDPTEENARTALAALEELVGEFQFASEADKASALSAMLTASIRSSLPLSPAFSISASRPGSGKSYLASLIACFGGPGEPYNTSYPTTNEEASKQVLSLMLSSPAVVCFDDMVSDWIAYPAINRMLTSETVTDRILGTSRVATARTATLIMGTGNNIRPLRDLARRVVSIYLSPRVQDITDLRYTGNPVQRVKADRARYVGHALTIISAYLKAGSPTSDLPTIPSFGEWSRLCRESLVWLGQPDPATSLIAQVNDDPDVQLVGDLLAQWYECFLDRPTMVRTVIEKSDTDSDLKEALLELPVAERGTINRSKLGRFLSRHANRIVGGLELRQTHNGERTAWTVVAIDEDLKAKDASARERPFDPAKAWAKGSDHPNGGAAPGEVF